VGRPSPGSMSAAATGVNRHGGCEVACEATQDLGDLREESGVWEVPEGSIFGRFRPSLAPRPL
jgi:hypothetical protein